MPELRLPKFVAVIGYPHAGKDTIAKILMDNYGYQRIDDGWPIRQACMTYFNWSVADVTTHEGKAATVNVRGRDELRRTVMQDVGRYMEREFGEDLLPRAAIGRIQKENLAGNFVFPSVRMKQGWAYREAGGLVIEVTRDGCFWDGTVTENYDKSSAHCSIVNIFDGNNGDAAYKKLTLDVTQELINFSNGQYVS